MPTWNVSFDLRIDLANRELQMLLAQVHAQAQLTAGIPLPPKARRKINALHIMRAVRGTTGIEGAVLSEAEVSQIIQAPKGESVLPSSRSREEQEVRNAEEVMRFVADTDEPVITEDLIRRIHELTTQRIPYEHNEPGKYRTHPAQAGDYVPPREADVINDLMVRFVAWLNSREVLAWDPVVRAVAAHFYLVSIHPFGDGNGRTSRALESLLLYRGGINVTGFYSLSNYYYQHRSEYVEMLDHVRFKSGGELTSIILFAARALTRELAEVTATVIETVKIISFRDYARERLLGPDGPGQKTGMRRFQLLSAILDLPEFRTASARVATEGLRKLYGRLTPRTVQRDAEALLDMALVTVEAGTLKPNLAALDEFTARGLAQRALVGTSPDP